MLTHKHSRKIVSGQKWEFFSLFSPVTSWREKLQEEMMDMFETHLNWIWFG